MNPIIASFLVGAMVTVRKWSKGEMLAVENVLGIAGVAIGLTVLGTINKDLGRSFGALVVVSVALFQLGPLLDPITKKLG